MSMKPVLLTTALAVACGALALAPVAYAADGTITINGVVQANTCAINVNGSGSSSTTVTLPTVSTANLTAAGAVAGATAFSIVLSSCGTALNTHSVSAYWTGGNIQPDGNLKNTAATNNVEVQLLSGGVSGTAMTLNSAQGAQNSPTATISSGAATLNYAAQYYATAAASAGNVSSTVSYTLVYQ